ncbi:MAG: AI-2E family transporter [Synergistaceae bacterium]|nr:AI-2E family transporter [Synergistaceae bacterium]
MAADSGEKIAGMEKRIGKPRVTEACLVLISVFMVGFVLSRAERVAIPLMLAFILTLLLYPVVKAGLPYKIPPFIMVLVILVCFFAVFVPMGIFLNVKLQSTIAMLPGYYGKLVGLSRGMFGQYKIPQAFWDSINWYNTIGRYLSGMPGFLLNWLANLVMVVVFLIFMLLEGPHTNNRLRRAFRGERGEAVTRIADTIVSQISKYLRTLAVISLVTGTCVYGALYFLRVEFALVWAVLAFLLNFIPWVGSIVACIPPILVALVQYYPNLSPVLLTMIILLGIQSTLGNIVTPKVMGDTLDLSPIIILVSLMFWGRIWGVTGALLAVPIAVMIKIICENIRSLAFVAILMSSSKHSLPDDET